MIASVTLLKDYELLRLEAAVAKAKAGRRQAIAEYDRAKYELAKYLSLRTGR